MLVSPKLLRQSVVSFVMSSVLCWPLGAVALPEPSESPNPLFARQGPIELTLIAPFEEIDDERDKAQEYEGKLVHETDELDVKYTLRGNFRLRKNVCNHGQLWLDLKKKQVEGTLFEGQNKLKLVVQCRDRDQYQDYIGLEEQVYRMFNLLSPISLRTRLAWINYEDPDSGESRRQLGFLVQHHKKLAKSFDLEVSEAQKVSKSSLNHEQSSLVALFNFLIANTDYSMLMSRGDDACCHNTKALTDVAGMVYPLPYDFDQTGYVSPSYAQVSQGLNQSDIRDRVYRGFCVDVDVFYASLEKVLGQREAIMAIANEEDYVKTRKRKRSASLISEGFAILASETKMGRQVAGKCR